MEREAWGWIVTLVGRGLKCQGNARFTYGWTEITLVFLWSVLHDRPLSWGCDPRSWPDELRPRALPSSATMSRRLRRPQFRAGLLRLLAQLRRGVARSLLNVIDGKPLEISRHSKDPDARFGRGAGGLAKGYKLHAIVGKNGVLVAHDVLPMNHDERVVARQLVGHAPLCGYLLADRHYDDNKLYDRCLERSVQLLSPRRYGPKRGLGNQRHSPARLRSVEMLEHSMTGFGPQLHAERSAIETFFGNLSSAWFGLNPLPAWVRRQARVWRWVTAKLILFLLIARRRANAA